MKDSSLLILFIVAIAAITISLTYLYTHNENENEVEYYSEIELELFHDFDEDIYVFVKDSESDSLRGAFCEKWNCSFDDYSDVIKKGDTLDVRDFNPNDELIIRRNIVDNSVPSLGLSLASEEKVSVTPLVYYVYNLEDGYAELVIKINGLVDNMYPRIPLHVAGHICDPRVEQCNG